MALKLLKVSVNIEVKADPSDQEDLKARVYDALQILLESEELEFVLDDEDQEEVGDEE